MLWMLWGGWFECCRCCELYEWKLSEMSKKMVATTNVAEQKKSATFDFRICYCNQSFFHPNHTP